MKTNRRFQNKRVSNERKTLLIWITIVLLLAAMGAIAQTKVKRNETGVFCTIKQPADSAAKLSGDSYVDSKGIKYLVYVSKTGKYFVIHTSKKTGKEYKHYLKLVN
jgi:hypothetical protein